MRAVAHEVVIQEPRECPGVTQLIARDLQNSEKIEVVGCAFLRSAPLLDGLRMARQERLELAVFLLGFGSLGQRGAPAGVKEAFEEAAEELGSRACPRPATGQGRPIAVKEALKLHDHCLLPIIAHAESLRALLCRPALHFPAVSRPTRKSSNLPRSFHDIAQSTALPFGSSRVKPSSVTTMGRRSMLTRSVEMAR